MVIKYFDLGQNGRLSFKDFKHIFLPCEDKALRRSLNKKPKRYCSKYDFLPRSLELDISLLLEKEIQLQKYWESEKKILESSYGYSTLKAFNTIDTYGFGFVDTVNLGRFMRNNRIQLGDMELMAIIRRVDLNANNKVSFSEFSSAMTPAEPYYCSKDRVESDVKYMQEVRERDYYYSYPYYWRYPLYYRPYYLYDWPYYRYPYRYVPPTLPYRSPIRELRPLSASISPTR